MIPLVLVDKAPIPGGGELRLMRRGDEFSITIGGNELMNSRRFGSEEALARLSAARLDGRSAPRILIGGLGMGFTLRAALAAFGADATFEVAELVPAVVAWATGPMAPLFGDSLRDRRVTIHETDVSAMISAGQGGYDGILLDVDNGPAGLTREANKGLYGRAGLAAAHAALRPGGVLALWSATPDERFAGRFRATGFAVEEIRARAGNGRGARHTIWIGKR
jgi:spermidine synthase